MVLVPEVVDAVGDRAHPVSPRAAWLQPPSSPRRLALAGTGQDVRTGSIWLTVAEADTPGPALDNMLAAGSSDTGSRATPATSPASRPGNCAPRGPTRQGSRPEHAGAAADAAAGSVG